MKQNWTYKKLGDVCDFQGGSQPPKEEWSKEQKPNYVRMLQIRDFTQSSTEYIEYVKESKSLKYCKDDDVLIGRYGASVGKILTGLSGAYNVAIIKSIPNETIVRKDYIKAYFLSPWFQHNLLIASQHRAAQAGFSKEDIADFPVPVPPLAEQQRIVSELDLLQGIIDKQQAQLKEMDTLAQSIFYDMFGDPVENEKGWEKAELNKVCDVRDGTHDSPSYQEEGYPLVTSKNVIDGEISFDNVNFISKEDFDNISKRSRVDDGDIIMPMIGTIGKPTIVKKDRDFAIKNVALIKFLPDSKVINVFIQAVMASSAFDTYMRSNNKGGTQKFIALGDIRKLKIPVPPLPLQEEFALKIELIERQKSAISQSIAETRKLFEYTMDKYFG